MPICPECEDTAGRPNGVEWAAPSDGPYRTMPSAMILPGGLPPRLMQGMFVDVNGDPKPPGPRANPGAHRETDVIGSDEALSNPGRARERP